MSLDSRDTSRETQLAGAVEVARSPAVVSEVAWSARWLGEESEALELVTVVEVQAVEVQALGSAAVSA
jgi:hypothetical protein